jgi:hypothetical protein
MGSVDMIYAQILNGVVRNTIILDNETELHLFLKHHDHCIRIDHLVPQPSIGWLYDGTVSVFSKIHNPYVEGGIPKDVPCGNETAFEPFTIRQGDYEFEVFLDADLLHIGCHVYNYKWLRYALWMGKKYPTCIVGPVTHCEDGSARYGDSHFHILRDDIDLIYNALCTLI